MKRYLVLLLTAYALSCSMIAAGQTKADYTLRLRSGNYIPRENINPAAVTTRNNSMAKFNGKSWCLIQFTHTLSEKEKEKLAAAGISLLEYIPEKTWIAELSRLPDAAALKQLSARSVMELTPAQKLEPALLSSANSLQQPVVLAVLYNSVDVNAAITELTKHNFIVTSDALKTYNMLHVQLTGNRLAELASLPFIKSVDKVQEAPQPLNFESRNDSRANVLQSALPLGYNLTGKNITAGVFEIDGPPFPHIDFINRFTGTTGTTNETRHATHVNGILGGAGLLNPIRKGYAPEVSLFGGDPLDVTNPSGFFLANKIVITNNSWGSGNFCNQAVYSATAYVVDKQANDVPYLQHIFACGNSGTGNCTGYVPGYNTVYGGQNSAKNTFSVSWTSNNGELARGSSRGPAGGGRLKPEIAATGNATSTIQNNQYAPNSGTSMSAPAVTGGLVLLIERYQQLHGGQLPQNALMKALLCNTATDRGNKGPDFGYGYGVMNLLRAVQALDKAWYFYDSVANQATATHTITVPAGTAQLKVMLYWRDPPASTLASRALVNDLDIQVISPSGSTELPYILDTLPSNVANPATKGEDHINNGEQVVIDVPAAGNYQVKVKAREVVQNPTQSYFVVYDIVPNAVQLTFPFGGEEINPGENMNIQWDAWGNNSSTFSLQFSPDNGTTWQNIATTIPATTRQYAWPAPAITTTQALIRVIRNADASTSSSQPFIILGVPAISFTTSQCPGYIGLQWPAVPNATDYQLMMIRSTGVTIVDSTTGTSYLFRELSEDTMYWVSVRARINGVPGRRANALPRQPVSGNCAGSYSDNDVKADVLLSPAVTGRKFTAVSPGANETIRFQIKSLDDQPATNLQVSYSVNGGSWIRETVSSIEAMGLRTHPFVNRFDFSAPGTYRIRLAVKNPAPDINTSNDTLETVIRQLDNPVLDLSTPVVENFEQGVLKVYEGGARMGLDGLDRIDIESGRAEIVANGISPAGGKAIRISGGNVGTVKNIIAMFNLVNYDTTTDNIALKYTCSRINSIVQSVDSLWIRGSETSPWIKVVNINGPNNNAFSNYTVNAIKLTAALKAAKQNFSSTFQVSWNLKSGNTYIIDDITLYNAAHDVELKSIDSLKPKSCNLNATVPIKVTVNNLSAETATGIKVNYKINGGAVVTETIPPINPDTAIQYTFSQTANFSVTGFYTIEAWIDYPGDSYTNNNKRSLTFRNQPLVSTFPYLENFENGQGAWYVENVSNSTWQLGTPASTLINSAASGTKAWKTNLTGNNADAENGYIYSPCMDFSSLTKPVISLSMALNTDRCNLVPLCDALSTQYSIDGGDTWSVVFSIPNSKDYNWATNWATQEYYRWHVASHFFPDTLKTIQFRFRFISDNYFNYEGAALDDFHIYDSTFLLFDSTAASSIIKKKITGGNEWINFTENGKVVAAIQPNGQQLDTTSVQVIMNPTAAIRNFHGQYYLNRNFIMQAKNPLTDSIGVRLYFMDEEADSLLFAKNCINCLKPANAYRFGISAYTSADKSEYNDSISDNIKGTWSFIENNRIKIVPYLNGYYAEFKVKDLSEFRFSNGGVDNKSYLPNRVLDFSAQQDNALVNLFWFTPSEINIHHFDVEVAKGNAAYEAGTFTKVGEVASKGKATQPRQYTFTHNEADRNGAYYYRLRTVDEWGNYMVTKAIPAVFSNELQWKVYPNPSDGEFTLTYQLGSNETASLQIVDLFGRIIKQQQLTGNGFIQHAPIDIKHTTIAKGVYFVRVFVKEKVYHLKVIKQ